jgi:hypothetical protein
MSVSTQTAFLALSRAAIDRIWPENEATYLADLIESLEQESN